MRPCARERPARTPASTEARSATSSASASALPPAARDLAPRPRRASPRRAPRARRAPPRRRAPAAMARPMPARGPVTSDDLALEDVAISPPPRPRARPTVASSDCGESSTFRTRAPLAIFLTSPESTVPGPTSTKVVTPSRTGARPTPASAPVPETWRTRPSRHASAVAHHRASTLLTSGTPGRGRRAPRGPAPGAPAPASSARSGRARTRAGGTARLAPAGLARLRGAVDGRRVAGDHDLARRVDVGGRHHLALRRLAAGLLDGGQVEAQDRRHGALAHRHRLLHVLAAAAHGGDGVGERQRARRRPAPSTRPGCGPATRRGRTPRAASGRSAAMLVARIAGWVFAVSWRSSSGPSKQSCESGKPSASSASSKTARLSGKASASAWPMPTFCEPWPGKTKAISCARLAGAGLPGRRGRA